MTDEIQVLIGNAYCASGEVIPMFREHSDGRIREAKLRVHFYLWFNVWMAAGPQVVFPEVYAAHHAMLCGRFNINPAELKRLPVTIRR